MIDSIKNNEVHLLPREDKEFEERFNKLLLKIIKEREELIEKFKDK
jgi:hypothetical protein